MGGKEDMYFAFSALFVPLFLLLHLSQPCFFLIILSPMHAPPSTYEHNTITLLFCRKSFKSEKCLSKISCSSNVFVYIFI